MKEKLPEIEPCLNPWCRGYTSEYLNFMTHKYERGPQLTRSHNGLPPVEYRVECPCGVGQNYTNKWLQTKQEAIEQWNKAMMGDKEVLSEIKIAQDRQRNASIELSKMN